MRRHRFVFILVLVIAVTGCGATVSETFTDVGDVITTPSAAGSIDDGGSVPDGDAVSTITLVNAGAVDGPGVSIDDAIANATAEMQLVNGILLKDLDGVIWLCSALLESSPPQCGEPRLQVTNFPADAGDLDPANSAVTGLQENAGVVWLEAYQLAGVVEP